ncbi:MAG TPA: M28 family peptidase [Terriglobales bacterium]|nr:M28 family peptidase [Terriglobales bacterium]
MKALVLLLSLLASSFAAQQQKPASPEAPAPSPMRNAMAAVSPANIRTHVKFLSSDLLEGRGTGQRGGDIAAEYIASQFALYGLKPAGDNGTYMQRVPMIGIATDPGSTISLSYNGGKPTPLRMLDDIVAMDESQSAISDLEGMLVYVGYGIDAPEYDWNDYKGIDVKGKILLMLVNEPPSKDEKFFKGPALTYYGRWTYKYEEAARRGAAGVMLIHQPEMASYGWDVVRNSWGGERAYIRTENTPKLKLASWIQYEVAQQLAKSINRKADDLIKMAQSKDFKPIPMPVQIRAHMISKIRPFDSNNVLALISGSDPNVGGEVVMYSAHYDHLGFRVGVPGDNIYNGAVDNATGCGMLLEMARAYSTQPSPKRSILFAAVTGEEQGLLGSQYLGQNPPVPAGKISVALNFDGIRPDGIPEQIQVSGSERTSLFPLVADTAKEYGLDIRGDSNPGAGHYYRSDHFSFARVGIPAFSVQEGLKYKGHPLEWGVQREMDYNEKRYHQPTDEFDPTWDFAGLAELSKFGIELGWKIADQDSLAQWVPGDEFEAARKQSQQAQQPASK